jgi:hypothetical protein
VDVDEADAVEFGHELQEGVVQGWIDGHLVEDAVRRKPHAQALAADARRRLAGDLDGEKAYRSFADTADRLDYARMAKVVTAVFEALRTP